MNRNVHITDTQRYKINTTQHAQCEESSGSARADPFPTCSSAIRRNGGIERIRLYRLVGCIVVADVEMESSHRAISTNCITIRLQTIIIVQLIPISLFLAPIQSHVHAREHK